MCGIVGVVDYSKNLNSQLLKTMNENLHSRGPDDSGVEVFDKDHFSIGLAHKRLSILDLSSLGHQPMKYEHLWITYNGEVYNFEEIKIELKEFGYQFVSHSDTEVIIKAYHKWGIKCVDKFRGMFAFAIYDTKENKVLLLRDRVGVKPLYFYNKDDIFLFSSEIKAFYPHPKFEKNIDKDSLSLYLQFGYIQAPKSIYKNCHKLLPSHYLEFDLSKNKYTVEKYWDVIDHYKEKSNNSYEEAKKELEEILLDSFNLRMVSDVPVGTFLSGGIDSSLVTAILQKHSENPIKTFTIGFDDEDYNEAPFAKEIAKYLGTEHTEHYCSKKDVMEIIPKLPITYDEPFGDSSAIPTTLVSQVAKEKVSVVLSGDGGDEVFCGYLSYESFEKRFNKIDALPLKDTIAGLLKIVPDPIFKLEDWNERYYLKYLKLKNTLEHKDISNMFKVANSVFTIDEVKKVLNGSYYYIEDKINDNICDLEKMMISDFKGYLADDILVKVDRASMGISLETREPLLDNKIIEFVAKLPIEYKKEKRILKDILSDYIPKELFIRKKTGFGIPINKWLRNELKYLIDEHLNDKIIKNDAIFDLEYIRKLKYRFFNNKNDDRKIWTILMFQMWYRENVK